MNEKTNTLSLFFRELQTLQSILHTLRDLTRRPTAEDVVKVLLTKYETHPARLELINFEKRIKAIRQGHIKAETEKERMWKAYTRKAFYVQLRMEYYRRGLFQDVKRVLLESEKGSLETKTLRDEQGRFTGTETTTDDVHHPLTVELSTKRK